MVGYIKAKVNYQQSQLAMGFDVNESMFKKYNALRLIRDIVEQSKSIKKHNVDYDMRYILLISECDVIWKVLFSTNILNSRNNHVIFGSKFRDDEGSSLYN